MTRSDFDVRLAALKSELEEHSSIASRLGVDFERPVRSITDGYPENSVTLVGRITERVLKRVWRTQDVPGDPDARALNELIKGCRQFVNDPNTLNALSDIQRLRNRSAHDGYTIVEEDALLAVRRLLDVLDWAIRADLVSFSEEAPRLAPIVVKKMGFLAGIYGTLGFKLVKKAELSESTVYQLFCKQSGIRAEYVEIILTQSRRELSTILATTTETGLLETEYPMLSRFLVLEEAPESSDRFANKDLLDRYQVVEYEKFVDTIVDIEEHLRKASTLYPTLRAEAQARPVRGRLLETDARTNYSCLSQREDALEAVREKVVESANVLVVGRPGSGKSTLLKQAAHDGIGATHRRFRFYLDMSKKLDDERFSDFATREIASCMPRVERHRVYDVFLDLVRAGAVVCFLDGIDEAVHQTSLDSFLVLFNEIADVLSAESTVVMSSRYTFLADSPAVRDLLNSGDVITEKLTQDLHANGIDPAQLPRFSILRLDDLADEPKANHSTHTHTPLELFLETATGRATSSETIATVPLLAEMLQEYAARSFAEISSADQAARAYREAVVYLGTQYLRGRTQFSYAELASNIGLNLFLNNKIDKTSFRLSTLFRPGSDDSVLMLHSVFQEYFASAVLAEIEPTQRNALLNSNARLTEQLRAFLSTRQVPSNDDCILPSGTYLGGPSSNLVAIEIAKSVEFDRFPVTVSRYRAFLDRIQEHGCATFDAATAPPHHSHEPAWNRYKLSREEFYSGAVDSLPVTCIGYWDAVAFARHEGKRLPDCSEWEAAARGPNGRLFPWGDHLDLENVNCADSWAERPLVTYEAWREEMNSGGLLHAGPTPVDAHPGNVSVFGIREMSGNTWEICQPTVTSASESSVICGGSYDNPSKAVQGSSKALHVFDGRSNAVGFRCVTDLDSPA